MSQAVFKEAYGFLRGLEGIGRNLGYVDVKTDLGKETIGGRSRYWKAIRGRRTADRAIWTVVDQFKILPIDMARPFPECLHGNEELEGMIEDAYEGDEWFDMKGGDFPDQDVANEVFEFAVHKTVVFSVGCLQYCMNRLNYAGDLFPNMKERTREGFPVGDGDFGPTTLENLEILLARDDKDVLLSMFNVRQGHFYFTRFDLREDQEDNARGFFRRVKLMKAAALVAQTKEA